MWRSAEKTASRFARTRITRTNSSTAASYQASGSRDGSANSAAQPAHRHPARYAHGSGGEPSRTRRTNGTSWRSLRKATAGQSSTRPRTSSGEFSAACSAGPPPRLLPTSTAGLLAGLAQERGQPVAEVARAVRGVASPRCRRGRAGRARARGSASTAPGSAAASRRWWRRRPCTSTTGGASHRPGLEVERLDAAGPHRRGCRCGVSSVASPGNRPSSCSASARLPRTVRSPARNASTPLRCPDDHVAQHRQRRAHGRASGFAGPPRRAWLRPRSISTVQLAIPPAVNRIVAVVSASSGEYMPRSRSRAAAADRCPGRCWPHQLALRQSRSALRRPSRYRRLARLLDLEQRHLVQRLLVGRVRRRGCRTAASTAAGRAPRRR